MRHQFESQLALLSDKLISMGALCEEAIACSVKALGGMLSLAEKANEAEREIDRTEREIENLCLDMLLRQQPVAGDLRLVSAAMKMVTDMERIGDQAADIAEIAAACGSDTCSVRDDLVRMASAAVTMVTESIDSFVRHDGALARKVIADDDTVDALFLTVRADLVKMITADSTLSADALDSLMIAKYLERIADHATNIAEWAVYAMTGQRIDE